MKAGPMTTRRSTAAGLVAAACTALAAGTAWASPTPGFWSIRPDAGENLFITCMSADGNVVGAYGFSPRSVFFDQYRALRWTREVGLAEVPGSVGAELTPTALDATGSRIAGYGALTSTNNIIGWHQDGGSPAVALPNVSTPNFFSGGNDYLRMSRDGQVIVGSYQTKLFNVRLPHAYRWTAATGPVPLDDAGFGISGVSAISGDGRTIYGSVGGGAGAMWRDGGPAMPIPHPPSASQVDISAADYSGDFAAGIIDTSTSDNIARWSFGVPEVIPNPAGMVRLSPVAITDGGQSIAATALDAVSGSHVPFLWRDGLGFDRLDAYLMGFGLHLESGFTMTDVTAMSSDGLTFAGWGRNSFGEYAGWVATVPSPAAATFMSISIVMSSTRRRRGR